MIFIFLLYVYLFILLSLHYERPIHLRICHLHVIYNYYIIKILHY